MVDYINPNVNEKWNLRTDVANTKSFASWIAAEDASTIPDAEALKLYHKIKLIVSDEANVVSDSVTRKLKADADFMNAVDVVGYHYKTVFFISCQNALFIPVLFFFCRCHPCRCIPA